MRRRLSHTKENLVIVTLVFLILVTFFLIVAGDGGISALQSKRKEHQDVMDQNQGLRLKNYEAYREIERLKNDPILIESVARTDLGMVRKDEMVFKPQNPSAPLPSSFPEPKP